MAVNLVTIIKTGASCHAVPDPFKAKEGSEVMFDFEGHPDAVITFDGESPFGAAGSKAKLKPEKNKVKQNAARPDKYTYKVTWGGGGGQGAGSGEIIP